MVATVVATALLAAGLVIRRPIGIPVAIVLLAAPYVAVLGFEVDGLDTRAPLIAALLFSVAELAYWSLELRGALADEPGTHFRRLALLAALAMGTIAGGTVVLVVAEQVAADGPAFEIAGAAAAVGAIALLALAVGRRNS
ncbi:MAG: hypothetical protein ACJ743_02420 [Gaiellaceae bacterium]